MVIATNQSGSAMSRITVPGEPEKRDLPHDLSRDQAADGVVANGMALATSLGLQLDPEAVLQLIHHGIDAK